jgi:toxin ParE1/3/4
MDCNVSFTVFAIEDIDKIMSYISTDLANPTASENFFKKLNKTVAKLAQFPKCAAVIDNSYLSGFEIRKLPISNYLLYYQFKEKDNCVLILRVLFGKRDPEKLTEELNI